MNRSSARLFVVALMLLTLVGSCKAPPPNPIAPGGVKFILTATPSTIGLRVGTSTITAFITDTNNIPIEDDKRITFSTSLGIMYPVETFTKDGKVVSSLRSEGEAGTATVTVTANSTDTATIKVVIGKVPAAVNLTANPNPIPSGQSTSRISAVVLAQDGKPIAGIPVLLSTTKGSLASPGSVTTDSQGRATDLLTTTEDATVTAKVLIQGTDTSGNPITTEVTGSVTVTVAGSSGSGSIAYFQVTGTPRSMNQSQTQSVIEALARDNNGSPMKGIEVIFVTDEGYFSPDNSTVATRVTDSNGSAGTTLNLTEEATATVTASTANGAKTATVQVSKQLSIDVLVSASPNLLNPAGGLSTITANILDDGNPVSAGKNVYFETTAGTLSAATVATDSSGLARTILTLNRVQDDTATVTASTQGTSGLVSGTTTVNLETVRLTLAASASTLPTGTSFSVDSCTGSGLPPGIPVTVTATLTDLTNNPLLNETVVFSLQSTGLSSQTPFAILCDAAAQTTDGSGVATNHFSFADDSERATCAIYKDCVERVKVVWYDVSQTYDIGVR